jgi:hypothetical protein
MPRFHCERNWSSSQHEDRHGVLWVEYGSSDTGRDRLLPNLFLTFDRDLERQVMAGHRQLGGASECPVKDA